MYFNTLTLTNQPQPAFAPTPRHCSCELNSAQHWSACNLPSPSLAFISFPFARIYFAVSHSAICSITGFNFPCWADMKCSFIFCNPRLTHVLLARAWLSLWCLQLGAILFWGCTSIFWIGQFFPMLLAISGGWWSNVGSKCHRKFLPCSSLVLQLDVLTASWMVRWSSCTSHTLHLQVSPDPIKSVGFHIGVEQQEEVGCPGLGDNPRGTTRTVQASGNNCFILVLKSLLHVPPKILPHTLSPLWWKLPRFS